MSTLENINRIVPFENGTATDALRQIVKFPCACREIVFNVPVLPSGVPPGTVPAEMRKVPAWFFEQGAWKLPTVCVILPSSPDGFERVVINSTPQRIYA